MPLSDIKKRTCREKFPGLLKKISGALDQPSARARVFVGVWRGMSIAL